MLLKVCFLWVLVQVVVGEDKFKDLKLGAYKYLELTTPIEKGPKEKREYLGLVLPNKMQVLLVSDPKSDLSAAALDVAVGSMKDPKAMPGLAHFCEHLLFRGSKKYPEPNSFFGQVESNGGTANAHTYYDHTSYHFSVNHGALEDTLDIFSQFFISPLFSEETVEKEVNVVNSEHQNFIQYDYFRTEQVQLSTLNKSHPLSHFTTGNYDTLFKIPKSKGIDPRKEVIKFYKEYYSANLMSLVVIGREPLDQLKNMTISRFSSVPNSNITRPSIPFSPFSNNTLGVEIDIIPVEDTQKLILQFPLPSQSAFYREKPALLIGHFLGHESEGSIMEHLKKMGWATSVAAGTVTKNIDLSILDVHVELTPLGFEKRETIVQLILEYAKLIKEKGVTKTYFDEFASLKEIEFRFQERADPESYASDLAESMHSPAPLSAALTTQHLMTRFDAELIQNTLGYITKDNLRLSVVASSLDANLIERWYGTNYSIKKLPNLKPTGIKLKLPPPNTYIPDNFNLLDTSPQIQLLRNTSQSILWYAGNPTKSPRVSVYMLLRNNMVSIRPGGKACVELMAGIIKAQLTAFAYNPSLAGLTYKITPKEDGLEFEFHGYSQKIKSFIIDVLKRMKRIKIPESAFNIYKEKYAKDVENKKYFPPDSQGIGTAKIALNENRWPYEMLSSAIDPITHSKLLVFTKDLFSSAYLEMLVVGNVEKQSANQIMNASKKILKLKLPSKNLLRSTRSVILPQDDFVAQKPLLNKDEANSATVFYLDMYAYNDTFSKASTELLGPMLSNFAYDQLLTNGQLGYSPSAEVTKMKTRGGLTIIVQSADDPVYLESRIENMLENFQKLVKELPEETFQHHVKAAKTSILENQRTQQETAEFHWEAIYSGFYDFKRENDIVAILNGIRKDQLLDFISNKIVRNAPKRRKFSVHAVSSLTTPAKSSNLTLKDCGVLVKDIIKWRQHQALSPYAAPVKTQI